MASSLYSRRVLLPDGLAPATVHLDGDRIAAVEPGGPADGARDLGEATLLPALTDTHVHVDEPGRTEWEGFASATRAAAAGGVTLVVDMPLNSDPVTTSVDALQAKLAAAAGKLWVDVGFWGGVVPGNTEQLAPLIRAGVLGFKCFLCHSGIDDFPASDAAVLDRAMPVLRDGGVPLLVHAELESELRAVPADADPRAHATWLHSRPKQSEDAAVALVAELVERTGCPAHIVHLSSAGSLEILRRAKARGLPLTAETCPHYLGLAAEQVPDGATQYKCAPPIRERANQDRLWDALADGTIDFVVTDHSPCTPGLKLLDSGDFVGAWGGIASLQLGLRSLWTEAQRRGIPLERVLHWMSTAPAAWLGQRQRGRIAPGAAADLVAFVPEGEQRVDGQALLHRHPTTPWHGRWLAGEIVGTWLRGQPLDLTAPPRGRTLLGATRA